MKVSIKGKEFNVADEPADFWGWVKEGRYDGEWNLYDKFLKPEHTFVDLGAWVGSHSLYASTIAKRVVACEPDPVAFKIIAENFSRNGLSGLISAAIGKPGVVTLGSGLLGASTTRANSEAGGGIGAWEEGQQFEAVSVPLREYVEMMRVEDPMFLKIDVEGSEEIILEDLDFFRERKPTICLETHPWWWKDIPATWGRLEEMSRIYKHAYNWHSIQISSMQSEVPKHIIFTDGD